MSLAHRIQAKLSEPRAQRLGRADLVAREPLRAGRKACFAVADLVTSLFFHVLQVKGTLSEDVNELTSQTISDSALSQRRT